MKRRGIQILMMLVLICTLGISACKQDVGTPEDNAVTEPEEEDGEEEAEKEDFESVFPPLIWRIHILLHWRAQLGKSWKQKGAR